MSHLSLVVFIELCWLLPLELFYSCPCIQLAKLKWIANGTTIAGGNGRGSELNQFAHPYEIALVANDGDGENVTIYIADRYNHRIMRWKANENQGQIVAGNNGGGNRINQLNYPTDVIVSKRNNDSLIICDQGNKRILRWSLTNQLNQQIIIASISCWSLFMDEDENLYISDSENNEITGWTYEGDNRTLISGRNDQENNLQEPSFVFVDDRHSVYLSDWGNHRIIKWKKHVSEGLVVVGGQGWGLADEQLNYPQGLFVDQLGTLIVIDGGNSRIMRWCAGCKQGEVLLGRNGRGSQPNQFNDPKGLAFDKQKNIYIVDRDNHRVLKFCVDTD